MASDRLHPMLLGLGLSIYAPLAFLFPLDILLPVLFPAIVPKAWESLKRAVDPTSWRERAPDWPLLVLHITLGGFILLMFGALLTGATHYLERYMHPFFLLAPLWMLCMVERSGNAPRKARVLGVILAASLILVLPVRARDLLHGHGTRLPQMPRRHPLCGASSGAQGARLRGRHYHRAEPP